MEYEEGKKRKEGDRKRIESESKRGNEEDR